jgi:predicted amino acid-binding ACT domain protein
MKEQIYTIRLVTLRNEKADICEIEEALLEKFEDMQVVIEIKKENEREF